MCKHRKKVMSSQACISIDSCTELSKTKFFLYGKTNVNTL